MSDWRRMCCPIDFSPASRGAMDEAVELAGRLRAELVLVHVRHPDASSGPEPVFAPPGRVTSGAETRDEEDLASWVADAERLAPGLVNSVVLAGKPAERIVGFAREFDCDLIVMGTHGRTGLRHHALGSVAEQVIRTSHCPVLVVRRDA